VFRRNLVFCLFLLTSLVLAKDNSEKKFRHVLLISVDGLHALDVANFVESHQDSALAELSRHGITYSSSYAGKLRFLSRPPGAGHRRIARQPRGVL
jgi:hypothetical protein